VGMEQHYPLSSHRRTPCPEVPSGRCLSRNGRTERATISMFVSGVVLDPLSSAADNVDMRLVLG